MIALGTLLAGLGAKLVADVAEKTAAHKIIKGASPLMVVYARGHQMFMRHFTDHSRAVAFQRQVAKAHLPSHLLEVSPDGKLNVDPILTMNGLGDAWIRASYGLPKGPYSSQVSEQGKQGKHLVSANEYQAQAWADEYGPHYALPTTADPKLPYYEQSYGSTYKRRELPADIFGKTFYDDGGAGDYNLVNTGNLGNL